MMRFRIFIILFLFTQIGNAQNIAIDSIHIYNMMEIKPSYPGGLSFFNKFIAENFLKPASNDFKGGKMLVDFVIDTTGTVSDVRILRDIGFGTGEEAKRLLPTCEKWIPGKQNGMKVKVRYAMPITLPPTEPIVEAKDADKLPEYPGGMDAFYKLCAKNFIVPNVDKLSGKIFASFIVEADGSVSNIKIIRDIGYGTGEEFVRVLNLSERWIPGELNGKKIRIQYSLPINIQSN